jgi:diketogulonate reductase-like aldo/keto reductase
MRMVTLAGGEQVPTLGLGTWRMGERAGERSAEAAALRAGLDLGLTLIDTAEMYGEGGAEEVVADAIEGRRDEVFIVSKVYPHNASRDGAAAACERSLARLRTDRIDLYLLHWRGRYPLSETIEAFERLRADGKIRHWGVSNFDTTDMDELHGVSPAPSCVANQVLYNLGERGIEWDLISACRKSKVAVMAYTPLGEGTVLHDPAVTAVAVRHGVEPAAVALAWILRHDGMIAVPKAARLNHLSANAAAADLLLDDDDLTQLDTAYPPPAGASPLRMI